MQLTSELASLGSSTLATKSLAVCCRSSSGWYSSYLEQAKIANCTRGCHYLALAIPPSPPMVVKVLIGGTDRVTTLPHEFHFTLKKDLWGGGGRAPLHSFYLSLPQTIFGTEKEQTVAGSKIKGKQVRQIKL